MHDTQPEGPRKLYIGPFPLYQLYRIRQSKELWNNEHTFGTH